MYNTISMTQFAATISAIMNIEKPKNADKAVKFIEKVIHSSAPEAVDRVLIYNPDAVAMWLFQKYTEMFTSILERTSFGIPVKTVTPSWTPVCFGTMYTGAEPEVHGIMKYEKKIISKDSLFDALIRSGKKAAIVAVEESSLSVIFGGRDMDYYIMPNDEEVIRKARELIREDKYDLIVVYNQEYDDVMHETGVESDESLRALKRHIDSFADLSDDVKKYWKNQTSLVCWATDHGVHQMEDGCGNHGEDIEEDMNIMHFYGVYPAVKGEETELQKGRNNESD